MDELRRNRSARQIRRGAAARGIDLDLIKEAAQRVELGRGGDIQRPPRGESEMNIIDELDRLTRSTYREAVAELMAQAEIREDFPAKYGIEPERVVKLLAETVPEIVSAHRQLMKSAQLGNKKLYDAQKKMLPGKVEEASELAEKAYQAAAEMAGDEKDAANFASRGVSSLRNMKEKLSELKASLKQSDIAPVKEVQGRGWGL